MNGPFYGKYRGKVSDNKDPLFMGRIRAKVTALGDAETGWATPCVPFAGSGMGFFSIPPVDSGIWIEFESGELDRPIYSGGWWGSTAEVPTDTLAPVPYKKLLIKTEGGTKLILDDTPGTGGITLETSGGQKLKLSALGVELADGQGGTGITISTALGQKISIGPAGIEIDDGQGGSVKLQGPKVDVNNGALQVI